MNESTQNTARESADLVMELSGVSVGSALESRRIVVKEMDWTVRAGDFWVLAGLQGSGKAGIMSMLAGLTPPREGSYRLFGCEMPFEGEAHLDHRLKLGVVFEHLAGLLHQLTVRENISLPLNYHASITDEEITQRTDEILDLVGLRKEADLPPRRLSRADLKRATLGRALIMEPEVMLFDLPLVGLDPRNVSWWMEMFRKLHQGAIFKGRSVTLIVTAEDLRPWRGMDCEFGLLDRERFMKLGRTPDWADKSEPLLMELLSEKTAVPERQPEN